MSDEWLEWEWDETLFAGAAAYYDRGRLPNAPGLDADPGMIQEAQRLASERGVMNARWVQQRAEDLPAELGTFNVVTFAASFHWMDRPLVAGII